VFYFEHWSNGASNPAMFELWQNSVRVVIKTSLKEVRVQRNWVKITWFVVCDKGLV
jgi:hypothetical protein